MLALQLYLEGNGFWGSGRILGVSNVMVLNWVRNFGKSVKEYVLANMPNDIREIDVVEIPQVIMDSHLFNYNSRNHQKMLNDAIILLKTVEGTKKFPLRYIFF